MDSNDDDLDNVSLDVETLRRVVKPSGKLFWILIIGGVAINWFGGFMRFRARYPFLSSVVLHEFVLFLILSAIIAAAVGRKNWRLSLLVFWFSSLGVTGFFYIGAR
jgi:hypothetical protein